jgi:hypothetical protein
LLLVAVTCKRLAVVLYSARVMVMVSAGDCVTVGVEVGVGNDVDVGVGDDIGIEVGVGVGDDFGIDVDVGVGVDGEAPIHRVAITFELL